jgi:formylmethanofuran dehydrogenase subunit C
MTAMIFKLRGEPDQRLDLSALTPKRLAGLDEAAIAALPVGMGKAALSAGEVFSITMGSPADIRIAGGSARFDGVGAGMDRGSIVLEGEAGAYAGREMTGGALRIEGNAGPFAGMGLSGGLIRIGGDAGDFLGAAETGKLLGMRGGTIIVIGRAGQRAGDRMRRGLIAIGGAAGDFPASRMIAGTVAILGDCGRMPGYLMRRGTLLLGGKSAAWTPTFLESGSTPLTVMRLLTAELKRHLPASAAALGGFEGALRRFAGDMATLGKGEIILPGD